MSLSVMFHGAPDGDDGPFQLASGSGWAAFGEWAESLAKSHLLKELVEDGTVSDSGKLSKQLKKALRKSPPDNPDVEDTARQLLKRLGVGRGEESVTVINEVPDGAVEVEDDPVDEVAEEFGLTEEEKEVLRGLQG
jgi:hypothetical protein